MEQLSSRVSDAGPDAQSSACPTCGDTDASIVACQRCDKLICQDLCGFRQPDGRFTCAGCDLKREEEANDWWDWALSIGAKAKKLRRIERDDPALQKAERIAAAREIIRQAQAAIDMEEGNATN